MKRPLAVSAIALIWGIILADVNISHSWGIVCIIISIIVMILLYRPIKATLSRFLLLAVPFLLIGYSVHSLDKNHHVAVFKPWQGQSVTVEGVVYDEPEFIEGKTRFVLSTKAIIGSENTTLKGERIRVTLYGEDPASVTYGSLVKVKGEIKCPEGRRNLGGFNAQKFFAAREISGTMSAPMQALTLMEGKEAFWLKDAGYKIRQGILRTLDQYLPPKEASILAGMLIGYTADMPEEMEEDFRRAGLSHVMAVSGANIAFLLLPLLWFLQRIGFSRRWSSALSFPLMLFYVFATGMEASVVRAAIMAGVTLTGMLFWRRTDIFCSLAASAILILLGNSFMLFDPGFILSFSATLSLVIFHKPLYERLPVQIPKSIRNTLAGTLAAQLGVIPVIAYSFNTFSLISVLSNLLVVPFTGLLTLLGALLSIIGPFFAPLGHVLGFITRYAAAIILFVTESIAKIPWSEIGIATPSLMLIGLYYFLLIYFRYGHPRMSKEISRPILAGVILLCGAIAIFTAFPSRSLRIYFADVGQGDCILIRTPQNKNIIIDGGGSIHDIKDSYAGECIVVPLLYDLNMTEIDLMVATHGHVDHIGGLKSVMDAVVVKSLVIADAPDIEMRELTDYALEKGIPVSRVKEGEQLLREENLILTTLYPLEEKWLMPDSATTSANELSLVTRLDYGDFNALFTGDIGAETERRLLSDESMLQCDLLKIAHHGSKYSSDAGFLETVKPGVAVIPVGSNRYGHPSPDVLNRLLERGIEVFQTLEHGGVLVEVKKDDNRMRIITVRSQ